MLKLRHTSWEQWNFAEQLQLLTKTRMLVDGVGTARANAALLPWGSVELQTNLVRLNDSRGLE